MEQSPELDVKTETDSTSVPISSSETEFAQRRSFASRNAWWIAIIVFVIVAAAVAIPVGLVFGLRKDEHHLGDTDSAETTNSTTGNRLVVFGASYCDNGHKRPSKYSKSLTKAPYVGGRSSNGPVWVEYLSDMFRKLYGDAHLVDYAYAGAMAANNVDDAQVPDAIDQIKSYVSDVGEDLNHLGQEGRSLVIIHVGLNQVTGQFHGFLNREHANGTIQKSLEISDQKHESALKQAARELVTEMETARKNLDGRKSTLGRHDWVFVSIPPVQLLPEMLLSTNNNATLLGTVKSMTNVYNTAVHNSMSSMMTNNSASRVLFFDTSNFFLNEIAHPSTVNVTNVTMPCVIGGKACADPDSYFFWDSVHPTSPTHERWASYVYPSLRAFWESK